jgi:hypothetical protein
MPSILVNAFGLLIPESLFISFKNYKKILSGLVVRENQQSSRMKSAYCTPPIIKTAYKYIIIDKIRYINFPRIFLLKLSEFNIQDIIFDLGSPIDFSSDKNTPIAEVFDKYTSNTILYPYQEAAIEYIFKKSNEQYGMLYLQMDTGLGKSRVGCAFIAKIQKKGLVVVPTQAIAEQWREEFLIMYPNLIINIYKNTQLKKKKSDIISDVDIIIINTFRNKDINFVKNYSVIILDEAHEYHSKHNLEALWLSQTQYVLGLSATPLERPDGLDKYITLHLGDVIYPKDIPNFDVSSVNFKANIKIIQYEGCEPYCNMVLTPAGTISSIMTINNILSDPHRLALVVDEIVKLNNMHLTEDGISHGLVRPDLETPKKHGIFVFVETREFLIKLKNALIKHMDSNNLYIPQLGAIDTDEAIDDTDEAIDDTDEVIDDTDEAIDDTNEAIDDIDEAIDNTDEAIDNTDETTPISVLRGGITKDAFNMARESKAHIVLTTYGYSRRGISLPDMTALVLVSPRRNGSRQIIGRILRRNSDDKIIRQIIDIVDVYTPLKSQSYERIKIYKEKFGKNNITKINKNWNEFHPII